MRKAGLNTTIFKAGSGRMAVYTMIAKKSWNHNHIQGRERPNGHLYHGRLRTWYSGGKENYKKVDAYFTVEAALVMPFVIGVILMTIYLLFFQYDRCLMEQNAGKIVLRGCAMQSEDNAELMAELSEQSCQKDKRYLSWKAEDARIVLKGNRITIQCSGKLIFPFWGEMFKFGNGIWESGVSYEGHLLKPVRFIRNCKRITGGK